MCVCVGVREEVCEERGESECSGRQVAGQAGGVAGMLSAITLPILLTVHAHVLSLSCLFITTMLSIIIIIIRDRQGRRRDRELLSCTQADQLV